MVQIWLSKHIKDTATTTATTTYKTFLGRSLRREGEDAFQNKSKNGRNDGYLQQSWKQSKLGTKKEGEQNSKSFQTKLLLKEEKGVWLW